MVAFSFLLVVETLGAVGETDNANRGAEFSGLESSLCNVRYGTFFVFGFSPVSYEQDGITGVFVEIK